jgi:L-lactate dehydrogenase complex protein LldG
MTYDFATRFEKLSGIVHRVGTEAAAAATIADICQRRQAGCIALAGLAPAMVGLIEESCTQACPELSVLTEPYASADLPLAIDRADIGITGISFAIAQSGTMVEVADNDALRLVSSLPRIHIGLLRAEDIIDHYHDSAGRIRQTIAAHRGNLVISFISGPSRTGDIELKLTLGVHGPEEAHCVIIDAAA